MTDKPKHYVVMRRSGQVMRFGGVGADPTSTSGPYLSILASIANELASAGSTYDPPHQLFLNGKLVIADGLSDLAWRYHNDLNDAKRAAEDAVRNRHMPDWLPSDEVKPGYNPAGVGRWSVTKSEIVA